VQRQRTNACLHAILAVHVIDLPLGVAVAPSWPKLAQCAVDVTGQGATWQRPRGHASSPSPPDLQTPWHGPVRSQSAPSTAGTHLGAHSVWLRGTSSGTSKQTSHFSATSDCWPRLLTGAPMQLGNIAGPHGKSAGHFHRLMPVAGLGWLKPTSLEPFWRPESSLSLVLSIRLASEPPRRLYAFRAQPTRNCRHMACRCKFDKSQMPTAWTEWALSVWFAHHI